MLFSLPDRIRSDFDRANGGRAALRGRPEAQPGGHVFHSTNEAAVANWASSQTLDPGLRCSRGRVFATKFSQTTLAVTASSWALRDEPPQEEGGSSGLGAGSPAHRCDLAASSRRVQEIQVPPMPSLTTCRSYIARHA